MRVDIHSPHSCTIVNAEVGDSSLPPQPGQGRICSQCNLETWRRTSRCMWCGHERWAGLSRATTIVGGGLLAGAVIFPWLLR